MRTFVLAAALLTALSSTAAAVEAPASNIAFGKKALAVVDPAVKTSQTGVDTAKAATGMGLGGEKAKKKVEKAQSQLDTAKALQADLRLVADGKPPGTDGLIANLKADDPDKPATMDRLKAVPGIETVSNVLATPGVPEALVNMTPIDQVPGVPAGMVTP